MNRDETKKAHRRRRPLAIVVGLCLVVVVTAVLMLLLVHVMSARINARAASPAGAVTAAKCLPSAQSITWAALAAPDHTLPDGSLYGMQRWTSATRASYFGMKFPGLLSCAYTVSAILHAACYPIGHLAAVSQVASALSQWTKISDIDDLRPGDVVFWRPRQGWWHCPSDAHWHVGIAIGNGRTMDNDWWSGKPEAHSVHRLCVEFAYARRAPS